MLTTHENPKDILRAKTEFFVLLCFVAIYLGIVFFSGTLAAGPRITDDNQIYRLQMDLSHNGLFSVMKDEITTRLWSYQRFVPAFSFHKVVEAKLLGGHFGAWSFYTVFLGILAAFFLYLSLRVMDFSVFESFLFSSFALLGEQSVIFWKPIQGEGLGMLFLSLSLLFMGLGFKRENKFRYTILFIFFVVLATLSKESFILLIPGLILWNIWGHYSALKSGLIGAMKATRIVSIFLTTYFFGALFFIKNFIQKTSFGNYAGWFGFDPEQFWNTTVQFAQMANYLVFFLLLLLCVSLLLRRKVLGESTFKTAPAQVGELLFPILLAFVILLPQILLYMSSGFYLEDDENFYFARYLVPGMVGYAFMMSSFLKWLREAFSVHGGNPHNKAKGYYYVVLPVIAILCIHLSSKLAIAYSEASSYAAESALYDEWYDAILQNTAKEDTILVVYPTYWGDRTPVRVKFMLEEFLDRRNLYFLGIPEEPPPEFQREETSDIAMYAKTIRGIKEIKNWGQIDTLIIYHARDVLKPVFEPIFLVSSGQRFKPSAYRRQVFDIGFTNYYKRKRIYGVMPNLLDPTGLGSG